MQRFREHYQAPDANVFEYVNELRSMLGNAGYDIPPAQYDSFIAAGMVPFDRSTPATEAAAAPQILPRPAIFPIPSYEVNRC